MITPYAKKLVNKILDTGRISYGPFLKKFEYEFAKLCHRKFAVSSNSGTSSLQVALHALKDLDGWKDGDEVLVPAVTFVATSNVVLQNKLNPVFVDVDDKMYHINPDLIEKKITKRTRAIIPVHLMGVSCDMNRVMEIAKRHRLRVIEDSCEAVGVNYRGHPVGSFGDIACFSTYMAHMIATGVGGLSITNDPEIAVLMRSLVNHGRDSIYVAMDNDKGLRGHERFHMANARFSFINVGYSYRLTEFEGALGLAELRGLGKNILIRQQKADHLIKKLRPFEKYLQLPSWPKHAEHAFMLFPIVIKEHAGFSRDELIHHLEDYNVETRYLMPLINQPIYKRMFGDLEKHYPVARHLNRNGFYIGCHPEMAKADLNYVAAVFEDFFTKQKLS